VRRSSDQRAARAEECIHYRVGEKLMTYAEAAATRPEFACDLHRFVAEIRRIFSTEEIRDHLERFEREEREAAELAKAEGVAEEKLFETAEVSAARRHRFIALKELLTAARLGTLHSWDRTVSRIMRRERVGDFEGL
jgi:hypothetical protein